MRSGCRWMRPSKTPPRAAKVEALLAEVKSLRRLVSQELAPALDLVVGFNAMDGD